MTQPSSGGFNFGGTGQTATTSGSGFAFGAAQPQTTSGGLGGPSGFPLGTGTTGFALGGQSTVNPAATTAQSSSATSNAGSGFTLGGAGTGPSTGFNLGGTGTSGGPGFQLGGASISGTVPGFNMGGAPTTTTAAPTGFSLGVPSGQATAIRPTTATTTSGGGFTLGGAAATTPGLSLGLPKSTAASVGIRPGTTTSAPSGLIVGGATGTSGGLTLGGIAATKSSNFASSFGTSTAATTSTAAVTTTTAAAATDASKQMNYRQLEESINKWMVELEEQEKIFLQQATQVNAWDRLLVENGEKITHLNSDMERVKVDQQKLDHELDFIRSQQKELEELLAPLEKTMEELPSISYQQHADLERENTYQLAENIDGQLKRMVQDLKEIIDHLNTTNTNQDSNDPIQQITKILNAHMDSLQWLDQNTALVGRRVEDISKQMEIQRKEQERNFRLVYD